MGVEGMARDVTEGKSVAEGWQEAGGGWQEAEMQQAMAVYYTASHYTQCSTLGAWQVV